MYFANGLFWKKYKLAKTGQQGFTDFYVFFYGYFMVCTVVSISAAQPWKPHPQNGSSTKKE